MRGWGAQAASLPHPAACRMHRAERGSKPEDAFGVRRRSMFAAGCRELQAGSLRSPESLLPRLFHSVRNAAIGLMRVARRAGSHVAIKPASASTIGATVKAIGSSELTS